MQGMDAWSPSRAFGQSRLTPSFLSHSLGSDPGSRGHFICEDFLNAPDMLGEACGHGRRTRKAEVSGMTQFVMRKAQIVGTPDQIHAGFQRLQAMSGVPTFAREAGQPFTHGSIEPFDTSRIEGGSSLGLR
jgi:hypothetical protein